MISEDVDIQIALKVVHGKLEPWFRSKLPGVTDLSVSPLHREASGGSNETFFLDLKYRESGVAKMERLVLRWPPSLPLLPKYDMKEQYLIMKHLQGTEVKAPWARWLEEDLSVIGKPFYIVERLDGWVPPQLPTYHTAGPIYEGTPAFRTHVWKNAVEVMGKIHTLDWKSAGFDFLGVPAGGTDPIDRQIAYYEPMLRDGDDPVKEILTYTTEWLKNNRFTPRHVSLCWGDSRIGNLIFREEKVVGVLDWEMANIGDPEADLAWFLHMDFQQFEFFPKPHGDQRLEGLLNREETIAHYEKVTGRKVENYFYHDVFAIWRMAVICRKLQVNLRKLGYPMFPDKDINQICYDRLSLLLNR